MTDETETRLSSEATTQPADDKRFEVKWKKKGESSTKPDAFAQLDVAEAEPGDVATLQRELEAAQQRVRDLQDRWQRAAADLANLRRRTEQEKEEVQKFASMLLVQQLLPVLDNFDRALSTIPGNLQMLTWIQGVMLIERHLEAILEREGVTPVEAKGQPFNAQYHEAVAERETTEALPGTVLQEYQRGYSMHGHVIRPTLVEVAAAPAQPSGEPETSPAEAESTGQAQSEESAHQAATENLGP